MSEEKKHNDCRVPSVGKIDKVEYVYDFHHATDEKWPSILKAFNPFDAIAVAYAKKLAYKIEIKRLDLELVRIEEQAHIAHDVIDKKFQLKMEELQHRRIALIEFYEKLNDELQRVHIERVEVLKMAQLVQQKAFEPGLMLADRKMYIDWSVELIRELPHLVDKANGSLQKIVQALPAVEISARLLEG